MSKLIGIDLGTTFSLCAHFDVGGPQLIPNALGQFLTPSAVAVLPDGQLVVGAPALEIRVTNPERCSWAFKRWMGTDKIVKLGKHSLSPIDLSSMVLRSLKADAEAHFKESVTEAVITVPAYFNDNQRSATRVAGELAGLTVKRILNEPTAAALTYGFHDRNSEKKIIVLDLGGGTFDVTVMDVTDGALEIIATSGESFLGGEDFTDRIVANVLSQKGMALETAELKEPLLVARLRREAESAKRTLTEKEDAVIRFPNKKGEVSDDSDSVTLTRDQFATLAASLVDKLERPILRALRDSKREPTEMDDVILVGGATRMPLAKSLAQKIFKKEPLCKYNPDEVVALGAAVQAALIVDHRDVEDIVMTDVCPHTLGIEICKTFGKEHRDGYYLPIIFRNTTIPVSKEESIVTLYPNQKQLNVTIYQGESRRVEDNLKLGELKITGIPPGEHQAAYVRFTYDLNGILEVEVIVKETGKRTRTVIVRGVSSLDPKQIEDAVRKMQSIKFYPRDDVKNRHLVLLAERVLGEVPPFERDSLESLIDDFERGLSSGDPDYFAATKSALLVKLSQLGISTDATGEENHDA